ncbi:hypothetical protein [Massilia sp. DWR3-1-1]|uniref:hypothetical protein n=1 Tax=Massilia sp. DWR3-1-1 TaxID=2804559 RepID=UPI003CFB0D69
MISGKRIRTFIQLLLSLSISVSLGTEAATKKEKKLASDSQTVQINGQIFIVTKGQEAVKLALVPVSIITEKEVQALLSSRAAALNQTRRELVPIILSKQQELDQLTGGNTKSFIQDLTEFDTLSNEQVNQALKCGKVPPSIWRDCLRELRPERIERARVLSAQLEPMRKNTGLVRAELVTASRKYKAGTDPSDFYTYMDGALASGGQLTKSDADGKFSFKFKKSSRLALMAKASRLVGDKEETYRWIVWLPSGKADDGKINITLANDNLLETNCADCVSYRSNIEEHKELSSVVTFSSENLPGAF